MCGSRHLFAPMSSRMRRGVPSPPSGATQQEVDFGYEATPMAKADFGDTLESVIDLMNQPRAFAPGVLRFPVTSTPLFLRGKKGDAAGHGGGS